MSPCNNRDAGRAPIRSDGTRLDSDWSTRDGNGEDRIPGDWPGRPRGHLRACHRATIEMLAARPSDRMARGWIQIGVHATATVRIGYPETGLGALAGIYAHVTVQQ